MMCKYDKYGHFDKLCKWSEAIKLTTSPWENIILFSSFILVWKLTLWSFLCSDNTSNNYRADLFPTESPSSIVSASSRFAFHVWTRPYVSPAHCRCFNATNTIFTIYKTGKIHSNDVAITDVILDVFKEEMKLRSREEKELPARFLRSSELRKNE